jgi:hypothetical protein
MRLSIRSTAKLKHLARLDHSGSDQIHQRHL